MLKMMKCLTVGLILVAGAFGHHSSTVEPATTTTTWPDETTTTFIPPTSTTTGTTTTTVVPETTRVTTVTTIPHPQGAYNQMSIYLDNNFDWAHIEKEIERALEIGYRRILIGYYLEDSGCQTACISFTNIDPATKTELMALVRSYNAAIYLVVGGPPQSVEHIILSGSAHQYGLEAATYAKQNGFNGLDLNINLLGEGTVVSPFAVNGTFIQFAKDLISGAKDGGYDKSSITLTGQAPYFSASFVDNTSEYALSYLAITTNSNQKWSVNEINLSMINEQQNYLNYDDIFIQNSYDDTFYGYFGLGSSVKEVGDLGIPYNNIAILKPISKNSQGARTGFVDLDDLASYGCEAYREFMWQGGFIGWAWNSYDMGSVTDFADKLNLKACP